VKLDYITRDAVILFFHGIHITGEKIYVTSSLISLDFCIIYNSMPTIYKIQ